MGVMPSGTGIVSFEATPRGLNTSTLYFSRCASAAFTSGTVSPTWPLQSDHLKHGLQSPVRSLISVIVFKVFVFFSSMNMNQFNESIILLHLLKSFLFIPSMFRIPQIIYRHRPGIESETSTQSKHVSIKRNRNCGILKINDRLMRDQL